MREGTVGFTFLLRESEGACYVGCWSAGQVGGEGGRWCGGKGRFGMGFAFSVASVLKLLESNEEMEKVWSVNTLRTAQVRERG